MNLNPLRHSWFIRRAYRKQLLQAQRDFARNVPNLPATSVIHLPHDGVCPAGYEVIGPVFEWRGETWQGCWKTGATEISIDVLLGGEKADIPANRLPAELRAFLEGGAA